MLTGPNRRTLRLTGERVILRAPQTRDYLAWADVRQTNRDHLEPWEPVWHPHAHSRADWRDRLRTWRSAWSSGSGYAFFIEEIATRQLVGGIALWGVRYGAASTGTLGYWLSAAAEGTGCMTEAVRLTCAFGFKTLELERIEAATVPENARSQNVLTRCGFQREGLARQYLEIAGKRRDHILFARLAGDEAESA